LALIYFCNVYNIGSRLNNTGNIIIDEIAPGYTDAGNTVGQIVVIKPSTFWTDTLTSLLQVAHANDGAIKTDAITTPDQFADPVDPALRFRENFFDHVAEGCVLTGTGYGSNLNWSLTSGVVYINGKRYTVAAATGVVVASKDTYFDLLEPVSGQVATLVYTGGNSVSNNAASPALAANSVRIGIIQSGANIVDVTKINQGQTNKLLPISGAFPYIVTDSLGNLICPRDARRNLLAYREYRSANTTASTTPVAANGLTTTFIIPKGKRAEVCVDATALYMATGGAIGIALITENTIGGTQLASAEVNNNTTNNVGAPLNMKVYLEGSPTADTTKTVVVGLYTTNAGRPVSIIANGGSPAILSVKLV